MGLACDGIVDVLRGISILTADIVDGADLCETVGLTSSVYPLSLHLFCFVAVFLSPRWNCLFLGLA